MFLITISRGFICFSITVLSLNKMFKKSIEIVAILLTDFSLNVEITSKTYPFYYYYIGGNTCFCAVDKDRIKKTAQKQVRLYSIKRH